MDDATLRKLVWEEMLYADMRANYFGELVRRYLLWHKTLRVATLVGTSGSLAAALLSSGPAKIAVPILATALSLWLLIASTEPWQGTLVISTRAGDLLHATTPIFGILWTGRMQRHATSKSSIGESHSQKPAPSFQTRQKG